ncbi:hypothetical protein D3C81_1579380 [compost metagenome]
MFDLLLIYLTSSWATDIKLITYVQAMGVLATRTIVVKMEYNIQNARTDIVIGNGVIPVFDIVDTYDTGIAYLKIHMSNITPEAYFFKIRAKVSGVDDFSALSDDTF